MTCIATEDDENGDPIWQCECEHWNDDSSDECQNCGLYWE